MSAEMISADCRFRLPVGVLTDGTPFYAPVGEVIVDGSLVTCHLCGRALRSVTAHLRAHGWTKEAYCEAFGLERGQSLEGPATRKLRAAALAARLVFDPAIREGSAAGRDRARAGHLARDAAAAARGRVLPEQRRRKALRALATIPPTRVARANSERARGRGRRGPRLCRGRRLPRRTPGRRLDLAGDRRGVRPAPVLAPPPGRRLRPHRSHPLSRRLSTRPGVQPAPRRPLRISFLLLPN